ncbi:hypothetical protein EHQ57_10105 [Leptospira wolffii]|nr:hypothetical protein [Leptospira wolffii]TGK71442.1 hypothetical protein EHQ35_15050 [Leptospira wolffii]TGL29281.1 hypothetical protein EHQ57_10105 [Leptospira wolffii]
MFFIVCISSNFLSSKTTKENITLIWSKIVTLSKRLNEMRETLDQSGLFKGILAVFLITLVLLLHVLNGPIMNICRNIPPNLSFVPSILIFNNSMQHEQILVLRKYPTANDFGEAYALAETALYFQNKQIEIIEEEISTYLQIQGLLKFAFISLVFSFLTYFSRRTKIIYLLVKLIIGSLFILLLWLFSLMPLLYHYENSFLNEWMRMKVYLQEDSRVLLASAPTKAELEKLNPERFNGSWWQIDFFSRGIFAWVRRNIN